jgi:phosphatidylserine/phosphatidylglycerophosphate/cardiolipin synthase-like enzyme
MQEVYDAFLEDFKTRASELMIEIYDLKATNKELQNQFNDLYIQLAKETEKSLNWENYSALEKKNTELEIKYLKLERAFELLKKKTII